MSTGASLLCKLGLHTYNGTSAGWDTQRSPRGGRITYYHYLIRSCSCGHEKEVKQGSRFWMKYWNEWAKDERARRYEAIAYAAIKFVDCGTGYESKLAYDTLEQVIHENA